MIVKVRHPIEKPNVLNSRSSFRNNASNNNYRNKFYPENASFLAERENQLKKNISLPKITKCCQYNNPYNPENQTIIYFDKEEKSQFKDYKNNLTTRRNDYDENSYINNAFQRSSFEKNIPDISYSSNNNNKNEKADLPIQNIRNCNSNEKKQHSLKLYSLKDYREIKKNFDFIKGIEKGGLGPYIKDGKWNERKMLVEKMLKFSHDVKVINTAKITKYYEDSMSKQTSLYQYKKDLDLSARQKGWEFANNIEIPKINKKKNNQFDTILEKEDLEDTLEFYEKRHKELSKKIEKNKSK